MKKSAIYIVTVLLSALYIFFGNRIASKGMISYAPEDGDIPQKAKVVEVLSNEAVEYDMGDEVITGATLIFNAKITSFENRGQIVRVIQEIDPFYAIRPAPVEKGDSILIYYSPADAADTERPDWMFGEYLRTGPLLLLGLLFGVALVLFGRIKGVNTILSLVFTCLSIFIVFIPAILSGQNIYLWSILTCVFIIAMTLIIVNGANFKSLSAGIGCLSGILVTGLLTFVMDKILKLTGLLDEQSVFLLNLREEPIDLRAVIFAAILIGAIGALLDVSVSIAASLQEIHDKAAYSSFESLLKSGVSIGRDMMGTMSNTLILAYIGSSLSLVLLLVAYNHSLLALLNREMIVVEVLQALVGSFGILLTIPLTSVVCGFLFAGRNTQKPTGDAPAQAELPASGGTAE